MALIKCSECGNSVSDTAKTCPHCGYNLSAEKKSENIKQKKEDFTNKMKSDKTKKNIKIIAVILVIIGVLYYANSARYAAFSGEYYGGGGFESDDPNVIVFNEDGTGRYGMYGHTYYFDYKLTSDTVTIDTHKEFLPIYNKTIYATGVYDETGITFDWGYYKKRQ